jgi:hypothetical protein
MELTAASENRKHHAKKGQKAADAYTKVITYPHDGCDWQRRLIHLLAQQPLIDRA